MRNLQGLFGYDSVRRCKREEAKMCFQATLPQQTAAKSQEKETEEDTGAGTSPSGVTPATSRSSTDDNEDQTPPSHAQLQRQMSELYGGGLQFVFSLPRQMPQTDSDTPYEVPRR